MNSKARGVPEINLDEFERRLRSDGETTGAVEDPLAELTRLVNSMASGQHVDNVVDFSSARLPRIETPVAPVVAIAPPMPQVPAAPPSPELETVDSTPAQHLSDEGIEAQLRLAIEEPLGEAVDYGAYPDSPLGVEVPVEAQPVRSAAWYLKVGALAGVGVMLIVGAVAFKFVGVPGLPKTPPVIHAADGPVKVAPPSEAAVQSPGDSGSLLTKDSASTAPVKIVTHEEQPVDLAARAPAEPASGTAPNNVSTSPVAPNSETPLLAQSDNLGSAPVVAAPTSAVPVVKGIRTVSVRPDGTLIAVNATPVAPTPTPTPSAMPTPALRSGDTAAPAAIQPSTPSLDLPPAKPVQKSSARITASKTDTTVASEPPSAPIQLNSAPKPVKPLPTKLSPPAQAAPSTAPDVVAEATPADAAPVSTITPAAEPVAGGGWAVQLSAPRSDTEAQGQITRLQSKYASELAGTSLGVRKADVNGETIYRVRASGLSKADAAAMCAKIKASGGDCFVARN